jgi:LDH2 family malate/lactate/ureidoglycolate dehydrogenase
MRIYDLRRRLAAVFERLDLEPRDADALAGLLLDSELRGHPDHGVAAVGLLAEMYADGRLNPRPNVRLLRETDGSLVIDGDRGCGPGPPMDAMRWCIERARERTGMAVATVRDWQFLVGAPYVRLAAEAGLIGFACTTFMPLVAPPGGRTPVLGTNPFAYGLPAKRHPPVVLDVATTSVAMQKVRLATGPLPEGLIFDREGQATTDPAEFFSLAPLGTPHAPHKGFGLALLIEALAGGSEEPGTFLWALDPEALEPREEFLARMDGLIDQIKASGEDVVLPGERGARRHAELTAAGEVELAPATLRMLDGG